MNIQYLEKTSMLNGIGVRCVLWVSGCSHKCKGCQNPETWDCNSGRKFTDDDMNEIRKLLSSKYINGITFSGGDPLYETNILEITNISKILKNEFPNKTIWLYTGYLYEDIKHLEIMNYIDVLVDGEFKIDLFSPEKEWIGSSNQRVIDVKKSLEKNTIIEFKNEQ